MDGSILVALMSTYLSGNPSPPENPQPEPQRIDYRCDAIVDDRRRLQVVYRENILPDGLANGSSGPNGFRPNERVSDRARGHHSRRTGPF